MQNLYRLLRIARNMPVHTLAEKIGVTNSYINAIDKGTRTPSQKVEKSILTALDVSTIQFAYMQQKNAHIGQSDGIPSVRSNPFRTAGFYPAYASWLRSRKAQARTFGMLPTGSEVEQFLSLNGIGQWPLG